MNKLQNSSGETLVETLCALLVVVLVFLLLSASVVAASRLNQAVQSTDLSFHYSTAQAQEGSLTLALKGDTEEYQLEATEYEDENGYVFYKK